MTRNYDLKETIRFKATMGEYSITLTLGEIIKQAQNMQTCDLYSYFHREPDEVGIRISYADYYKPLNCYFYLQENKLDIFKAEVLNLGGGVDDEIINIYDKNSSKYGMGSGSYRMHDVVSNANKHIDDGFGIYNSLNVFIRRQPQERLNYIACYDWIKEYKSELFDEESGRFILPSELVAKQQPDVLPNIKDKFNELKTISYSLMNGTCKDSFLSMERAKLLMDSIDSLCSELGELDGEVNDKYKEEIKEIMNKVTKIRRFIGNQRKVAEMKQKISKLEEEFNKTNSQDVLVENMKQLCQLCKDAVSLMGDLIVN